METILYNISQVLGTAILHSIWQGLLVYIVLRMASSCFPAMSAAVKHSLAFTALLCIGCWFLFTLVSEATNYTWLAGAAIHQAQWSSLLNLQVPHAGVSTTTPRYYYTLEGAFPYLTFLYVCGLLFNTIKLAYARKKINQIKHSLSDAVAYQLIVNGFCKHLNLKKQVKVSFSAFIDVPCTIGHIKPLILLPITLTTCLSTAEAEAILLHELAHIKRNDYLLNIIQQMISVLLFFNPFAQLITRIINQERENCCDDIVVNQTDQPLIYAGALLKLEEQQHQTWQLALAATGKKYHLLNRIERIMKTKKPMGNIRHLLLALLILTVSTISLAWLNPTIAHGKISIKKIKPSVIESILTDTVKKPARSAQTAAAKKTHHLKPVHRGYAEHIYPQANDPELEKLAAEVSKHGDNIGKYFESGKFKKLQEEIEQKSNELAKYYSNAEIKDLEEKTEKISKDLEKNWEHSGDMEEVSKKMEKIGERIGSYYNSADFKKMNEQLQKKYNIKHDHAYHDDDNYKKYEDELSAKTPADIKKQTEELKILGEKIKSHYDSPEFKEKTRQLSVMGDSLSKNFANIHAKEIEKEMAGINKQMKEFQHDPYIVREKKLAEEANRKLHDYMNSPAFKKRMHDLKALEYNSLKNNDFPDKPELPEPPAPPEN